MRLSSVLEGARVQVVEVRDGAQGAWRAVQLGLAPGTVIEVLVNRSGPLGYPLLLRVGGRVVVVGRSLADKVIVRTLAPRLYEEGEEKDSEGRV